MTCITPSLGIKGLSSSPPSLSEIRSCLPHRVDHGVDTRVRAITVVQWRSWSRLATVELPSPRRLFPGPGSRHKAAAPG